MFLSDTACAKDRVQESRAKSAPSEQFADANAARKCSHSVKYFKYELPAPHGATRLLQATPQKPDSARQAPSFAAVAWRLREHMYLFSFMHMRVKTICRF